LSQNSLDELVEAQWRCTLEKGKDLDLTNVLVLSDVSASMRGLPMTVSISLGILISQLTNSNWKNLVMTFESQPKFHLVKGSTLYDQVKCLSKAPWGGSTNFQAALQLVLDTGIQNGLEEKDMPKKLIVISDMQFDVANENETNYDLLVLRYTAAGYIVPRLIFWNVNGTVTDFPSTNIPNVSLISGFSIELLKSVLKGTQITPCSTMREAIDDSRYDLITL
jgi:hypothetical protein